MSRPSDPAPIRRPIPAEEHFPDRGQGFLRALEVTRSSAEVWQLVCKLGQDVGLPCIDFISASDWRNWKRTLFVRTSYDASWLHERNTDPTLYRGSYFRVHGNRHLTPICMGLEFIDDYPEMPDSRRAVLEEAARRGMRAGVSIPLRHTAPPSAAMMSFLGDHDRATLLEIVRTEGWSLTVGAWAAHQRYLQHFSEEFFDRKGITPKQRELLELIGGGHLDKTIAETLGITISAVRQRLNALLQKTGAANRAELAALAMSLGVVPDPFNRPGSTEDGSEVYPRHD